VRIDSGVGEGAEVPIHYDPIIAKVIAAAETRALAIARLIAALRAFPILGVRTNVPFLLRILHHPAFELGRIDTGFLDREYLSLAAEEDEMPRFVRDIATGAGAAVDGRSGDAQSAIRNPHSWDPWG
jgi:acetyl/propionyl-CoA carboxylase alpha subunit